MSILSLFSVIPEEGIRFSHRWLLGIEFRTLEDQSVLLTLSHLSSLIIILMTNEVAD